MKIISLFLIASTFNPITEDLPPNDIYSPSNQTQALATLDLIIEATGASYNSLVALRQDIIDYQQLQEQYIDHPNDVALLFRLVKKAEKVMDAIQNNHLNQSFDSEFLKEVSLFARLAKKTSSPKA